MVNMAQGLKGRTVYSGGSFAPTRGPVSGQGVQGYLRREVTKGNRGLYGGVSQFGRDGLSDTRSGVAQRAMQRRGGQQQTPPTHYTPEGGYGNNPPRAQQQPGQQQQSQPAGQPVSQPPPPGTPAVTVNANGILELPYSPAWGNEVLGGFQDTNTALADLQAQQQAQAAAYAMSKKQARDQYGNIQRDTLNDNASRGVAFSSGYGVAVGKDANDFNNYNNNLDVENSQLNAGFDFNRTSILNAFKDQLRQASLDYANSLTQDAGTLGYGQDTGPVSGPASGSNHAGNRPRPPTSQGGWGGVWKPPKKPGGRR